MSLQNMEHTIVDELQGKQLWGDINMSSAEYEILLERIKVLLNYHDIDLEYLANMYPVVMTTLLVFLARYKYNTNYWGLLSEELEVPIKTSEESSLGIRVRNTFKKYHFDFSDVKNEKWVNLAPIFYEAGLPPESSLDDLFYILNYDSHSIFDPQLIIEDLIEMRSYQIRKPLLKFLKRFKEDRAVEFVMEVHEAMLSVDHSMSSDSHYIGNYTEWKARESSKETISSRKKQECQTKPYLSFDNGKRGLCMVLPRVLLKDEWIEEISWNIMTDIGIVSRRMNVFGDEGKRFIETITVPVCPSSMYRIELIDDENLDGVKLANWGVNGISEEGFLVFNSNGRVISPKYIPSPYGIIITGQKANITAVDNVHILRQAYPTDRAGYQIQSFESTARDGRMTITCPAQIYELNTRPHVEMNFEGTTLFHLDSSDSYRFYTEIPRLSIDIGEGAIADGIVLRIGSESIGIDDFFESGIAKINLSRFSESIFTKLGIYSIRLYQNDHFIKQTEFTLLPEIPSNYYPHFSWSGRVDYSKELLFRFKKIRDFQMEFQGCRTGGDEDAYITACPPGIGSISVKLDYSSEESEFSCLFELPVRPFEYSILDSNENTKCINIGRTTRVGLTDLLDEELWAYIRFFGKYQNEKYSLRVRSVNGIEQEEPVLLTQNGCVNKNLSVFHDTLRSCPLPAQIELYHEECADDAFPLLIVADTMQLSHRPGYNSSGYIAISVQDEERNITVSSFRNPEMCFRILYSESLLGKSGKTRGYKCPHLLDDGFYVVESDKSNSAFEFEEETSTRLSNGNDTIYVSSRNRKSPIITFSDWLDQLIRDILSAGIMNDINTAKSFCLLDDLNQFKNTELHYFDYERIVSLAYFLDAKCSNDKKISIGKCMKTISQVILDDESRLQLIRTLVTLRCPAEIMSLCIQHYKLHLFMPGTPDAITLAEQIENDAIELSILLRMSANDSLRNILGREKFRDIIGKESLKLLLNVPSVTDPSAIIQEQRLFLRERPSKVRIHLDKDISGEMEPIVSNMLEITYNKIFFHKSKKPDIGAYFDHIRYVDQYVNWYVLHSVKDKGINPETSKAIVETVNENCRLIVDAINDLKQMTSSRKMTEQYDSALRARFNGDLFANMKSAIPARFFYLQGLAAYLSTLPHEYRRYKWHVKAGEGFMVKAFDIAPRIARRDILMASTYLYLISKEEQLCR